MPKKITSLLYGNQYYLLDHLAPLCELLDIPLIVTDEYVLELANKYYPHLETSYENLQKLTIPFLAEWFDILLQCNSFLPHQKQLFQLLSNKDMKLIACPHGNSDKGHLYPIMQSYTYVDLALLYGDHQMEILKKQNLFKDVKDHEQIGNIRLLYYLENRAFLDKLTEKKVFSPLSNYPTIFYAPTWNDHEDLSSFSNLTKQLIDDLPSGYNLIIKPHPRLKKENPAIYYSLLQDKDNISIIEDFPLIYPILSKVDLYVGDFSSIGYDFLYFQKPMVFFDKKNRDPKKDPSLLLHQCGYSLSHDDLPNIYSIIENMLAKNRYKQKQKALYQYAFGKEKNLATIKNKLYTKVYEGSFSHEKQDSGVYKSL